LHGLSALSQCKLRWIGWGRWSANIQECRGNAIRTLEAIITNTPARMVWCWKEALTVTVAVILALRLPAGVSLPAWLAFALAFLAGAMCSTVCWADAISTHVTGAGAVLCAAIACQAVADTDIAQTFSTALSSVVHFAVPIWAVLFFAAFSMIGCLAYTR